MCKTRYTDTEDIFNCFNWNWNYMYFYNLQVDLSIRFLYWAYLDGNAVKVHTQARTTPTIRYENTRNQQLNINFSVQNANHITNIVEYSLSESLIKSLDIHVCIWPTVMSIKITTNQQMMGIELTWINETV